MKKLLQLSNKTLILLIVLSAAILVLLIKNMNKEPNKIYLQLKNGIIYNQKTNKPFTGHQHAKVKGKIVDYDIVNGKKDGEFKISYLNGNPQIIGKMKMNKNVGEWKYYYSNGNIESCGNFSNDTVDGLWKWYYENGNLKTKGKYIKGKKIGEWVLYDQNGGVNSRKNYLSKNVNPKN